MREPKERCVRFNFHPELCVGCGACVTACIDEHDAFPVSREPLRRIYRTERTRNKRVSIVWYSLACLHCEQPECAAACPQNCFSTDPATGTVQLDNTNCIGCGACVRGCRFQGVVQSGREKVTKCDGCVERLRMGLLPRCVTACPRQAITVDDRPAVRREAREKLAQALGSEKLRR